MTISNTNYRCVYDNSKDYLTTEGIKVKQTINQSDAIDFDIEAGIDWSGIDTVPELLDPVLTSNGTHPNSILDALREAALYGSIHPSILF